MNFMESNYIILLPRAYALSTFQYHKWNKLCIYLSLEKSSTWIFANTYRVWLFIVHSARPYIKDDSLCISKIKSLVTVVCSTVKMMIHFFRDLHVNKVRDRQTEEPPFPFEMKFWPLFTTTTGVRHSKYILYLDNLERSYYLKPKTCRKKINKGK